MDSLDGSAGSEAAAAGGSAGAASGSDGGKNQDGGNAGAGGSAADGSGSTAGGAGGQPVLDATAVVTSVRCGEVFCGDGEVCCSDRTDGTTIASCVANASSCSGTVHRCDDDSDCAAPDKCYAPYSGARCVETALTIRIACSSPDHCAPSELCCAGTFELDPGTYRYMGCVDSLADCSDEHHRVVCETDADCGDTQQCLPGDNYGPVGHKICTPW